MDKVLVTGVTGFIGSHVAALLLDKGYFVRGTVRSLSKGQRLLETLREAGHNVENLELVRANLTSDEGWAEACKGCRYIQHIASPFPLETPSNREALVPEARAGTQRVLENGLSAGAERIVLTSSVVSMMGQPDRPRHFVMGEDDWTDPDWKPLQAYQVSKTRAEKSAWAYVKAQGMEDKLVVVNPGVVFGPDSFDNSGSSLELISMLVKGEFPMVPKVSYPVVDVRDVAAIHVSAMTAPKAAGRRLIAASETMWMKQISDVIRADYPHLKELPKGQAPSWLLRIIGKFDNRLKAVLPDLDIFQDTERAYVTTITGVVPRKAKVAILASVKSLLKRKA